MISCSYYDFFILQTLIDFINPCKNFVKSCFRVTLGSIQFSFSEKMSRSVIGILDSFLIGIVSFLLFTLLGLFLSLCQSLSFFGFTSVFTTVFFFFLWKISEFYFLFCEHVEIWLLNLHIVSIFH